MNPSEDSSAELIAKQLRQRRDELRSIERLAEAGTRTVELDQSRMGRLSRADALQSQEMSKEGKRRRDLELQRIEAALQRVAAGSYGICTRCEDEIGIRRLQANPAAVLCIECAERGESR